MLFNMYITLREKNSFLKYKRLKCNEFVNYVDELLLTLAERKTHNYISPKIANNTAKAVMSTLGQLREEYGKGFSRVFKSIPVIMINSFVN